MAETRWTIVFGFESARRGQNPASGHSRALVHSEHFDCEGLAMFAFDTWVKNPPCQCDWIALAKVSGDYPNRQSSFVRGHSFAGQSPDAEAQKDAIRDRAFPTLRGEIAYLVGSGDTAYNIASALTGDGGRYQELIFANPKLKTVGEQGVYIGEKSLDFAPSEMQPGVALVLPGSWSREIVSRAKRDAR